MSGPNLTPAADWVKTNTTNTFLLEKISWKKRKERKKEHQLETYTGDGRRENDREKERNRKRERERKRDREKERERNKRSEREKRINN